jgi:hypothetical protein
LLTIIIIFSDCCCNWLLLNNSNRIWLVFWLVLHIYWASNLILVNKFLGIQSHYTWWIKKIFILSVSKISFNYVWVPSPSVLCIYLFIYFYLFSFDSSAGNCLYYCGNMEARFLLMWTLSIIGRRLEPAVCYRLAADTSFLGSFCCCDMNWYVKEK